MWQTTHFIINSSQNQIITKYFIPQVQIDLLLLLQKWKNWRTKTLDELTTGFHPLFGGVLVPSPFQCVHGFFDKVNFNTI